MAPYKMVKNLPSKSKTQCFLEVLAGIRNGLQSSAKILYGRNLVTKKAQPWTTILLGTSYKRDR